MIKYILSVNRVRRFLLLNLGISINFQLGSINRNSNEHVKLQEQTLLQ